MRNEPPPLETVPVTVRLPLICTGPLNFPAVPPPVAIASRAVPPPVALAETPMPAGLDESPYTPMALPEVALLAPYTPYPLGPEEPPATPVPLVAVPYNEIPAGLTVVP